MSDKLLPPEKFAERLFLYIIETPKEEWIKNTEAVARMIAKRDELIRCAPSDALREAERRGAVDAWDKAIMAQCEFCGQGDLATFQTWDGLGRWWHGDPKYGHKCQADYIRAAKDEELRLALSSPTPTPPSSDGALREAVLMEASGFLSALADAAEQKPGTDEAWKMKLKCEGLRFGAEQLSRLAPSPTPPAPVLPRQPLTASDLGPGSIAGASNGPKGADGPAPVEPKPCHREECGLKNPHTPPCSDESSDRAAVEAVVEKLINEADCCAEHGGDLAGFVLYLRARLAAIRSKP